MIKIAPSILSADFSVLAEEAQAVAAAGADWLHVDVMDGNFVPNITMGPCVVRSLRPKLDLFFDVHLMITDPLTYVPEFASAGADLICFHAESDYNIARVLDAIEQTGKLAGLAVRPNTPIETVYPYLDRLALVLVMTVEPGFGGQKFLSHTMDKVRAVRAEAARRGRSMWIEVDGGINTQTAGIAVEAGATVLVAGSAVYDGTGNYSAPIARLRDACAPYER